MQNDSQLREMIHQSFGYQRLIFYGMGIVTALVGVGILILSFTMPVRPGEENIVLALQITAVVFILFLFWAVWYVRRREGRVLNLLFEHPEEIESVKSVTVQRQGVQGRAIRLYTRDGKMVGFNVNGPERQQALVELLKLRLKEAGVASE